MNENTKILLKNLTNPYIFYGLSFSTVFLHYFFSNAFTGILYFIFMATLTAFLLIFLIAIFMIKKDPASVKYFIKEESKIDPKYSTFKRMAGVLMLYLFVAFNWIFSFAIWLGIIAYLIIHSSLIKKAQ
jgi:hypothetical protein